MFSHSHRPWRRTGGFAALVCLGLGIGTSSAGGQALARVASLGGILGARPRGDPVRAGTDLYFTCSEGGATGGGTLCRWNHATTSFAKVADFDAATTGSNPLGTPFLSGGFLYITCSAGGVFHSGTQPPQGDGTICRYDLATGTLTKIWDLSGPVDGRGPRGGFTESGGELYFLCTTANTTTTSSVCRLNPVTGVVVRASLFSGATGLAPVGEPLVLGAGEMVFACSLGGSNNLGAFLRRGATGVITSLGSLSAALGGRPLGSAIQTPAGVHFLCSNGGVNGDGTIVRWQLGQQLQKVADLQCATLGQAPSGNLATFGGDLLFTVARTCSQGCSGATPDAAILKYAPGGAITVEIPLTCPLFITQAGPGPEPDGGILVVDNDLFFTTSNGGPGDGGTLGRYSPSASVTAAVQPLGPGCASGPFSPLLATSNPVIGAPLQVDLTGAPPLLPGGLFISFPPAGGFPNPVAPCPLYLDLPTFSVQDVFTASPAGAWSLAIPVPANIALVAVRYRLQAALDNPAVPAGIITTNGLELLLGY